MGQVRNHGEKGAEEGEPHPQPHLEQQEEQREGPLVHGPKDLQEQVDEGHVVTLGEGAVLTLTLAHAHELEALGHLEGPRGRELPLTPVLAGWGSDAGLGSPVPEFRAVA